MIVNLKGIENTGAKKWIKNEGHMTLKCVNIKEKPKTINNNRVFEFEFKNKNDEYIKDEVVITDNTLWKIKQMADAFGFDYDNVNIFNFKDLYLVGWVKSRKYKNRADQVIDVFEIKDYAKSAKLVNEIPPENSIPTVFENVANDIRRGENYPEIDIYEDEIPF